MQRGTGLELEHVWRPAAHEPKVEREGKKPPMLLLLHGRGADEMDLMGLADALDPRLTVVSARAPLRLGYGYTWYHMPQIGQPDPASIRDAVEKLKRFIGALPDHFSADSERLYLMGFSQGGIIGSALALLMPGRFRGLIMHSSYVPTTADLPFEPENVRGVPFFIAHGKYDAVIPPQMGEAGADYLRKAGAEVTYREYPIAHQISEESLYDLSDWLTAQVDASEG
jgi:phospholipase/carboxylesterase